MRLFKGHRGKSLKLSLNKEITYLLTTTTTTTNNNILIYLFQEDNIYGMNARVTYGPQLQR